MRDDGPPTLPNLPTRALDASDESQDPGGTPTWPIVRGHNHPSSANYLMPLMLGASLVLNVLLFLGLLSVLVLGRSGFFSQGGSPAGSGFTASPSLSSPAATTPPTVTAVTSPTPVAGWLQVTPTSVQLGCNGNQQTQFVVLDNTGPAPVQWQVAFSLPVNQVGVNVGPNQGTLNPGSSVPVQIQNQTHAHGPQGVPGQQGTIEFDSDTPDAGPSPSLTYTTVGC